MSTDMTDLDPMPNQEQVDREIWHRYGQGCTALAEAYAKKDAADAHREQWKRFGDRHQECCERDSIDAIDHDHTEALPAGICVPCGQVVVLRPEGRLGAHKRDGDAAGCPGSGEWPATDHGDEIIPVGTRAELTAFLAARWPECPDCGVLNGAHQSWCQGCYDEPEVNAPIETCPRCGHDDPPHVLPAEPSRVVVVELVDPAAPGSPLRALDGMGNWTTPFESALPQRAPGGLLGCRLGAQGVAHEPHGTCLGRASEYPSELVLTSAEAEEALALADPAHAKALRSADAHAKTRVAL